MKSLTSGRDLQARRANTSNFPFLYDSTIPLHVFREVIPWPSINVPDTLDEQVILSLLSLA